MTMAAASGIKTRMRNTLHRWQASVCAAYQQRAEELEQVRTLALVVQPQPCHGQIPVHQQPKDSQHCSSPDILQGCLKQDAPLRSMHAMLTPPTVRGFNMPQSCQGIRAVHHHTKSVRARAWSDQGG